MFKLAGTLLALALGVQTVTISLWNDIECEDTRLYTCTNIPEGRCCTNGPSGTFVGALFNGLPLPAGEGIVYPTNRSGAFGCTDTPACDAGFGSNECLYCNTSLVGANWINAVTNSSKSKRELDCNPVDPDIIHFPNGRDFDIFHDVPINDSLALVRLREEDPELERGVPEELKKYERH